MSLSHPGKAILAVYVYREPPNPYHATITSHWRSTTQAKVKTHAASVAAVKNPHSNVSKIHSLEE